LDPPNPGPDIWRKFAVVDRFSRNSLNYARRLRCAPNSRCFKGVNLLKQKADKLVVAVLAGEDERGAALRGGRPHVRPLRQHLLHHCGHALDRREDHRRQPVIPALGVKRRAKERENRGLEYGAILMFPGSLGIFRLPLSQYTK